MNSRLYQRIPYDLGAKCTSCQFQRSDRLQL